MHFLEWKYMCLFGRYFQLTISQHGSDNDLALNRQEAIFWTNDGVGYQRIYASLGLKELI